MQKELYIKEIKNKLPCDLIFIAIMFYQKQSYKNYEVCIGYVLWQKK